MKINLICEGETTGSNPGLTGVRVARAVLSNNPEQINPNKTPGETLAQIERIKDLIGARKGGKGIAKFTQAISNISSRKRKYDKTKKKRKNKNVKVNLVSEARAFANREIPQEVDEFQGTSSHPTGLVAGFGYNRARMNREIRKRNQPSKFEQRTGEDLAGMRAAGELPASRALSKKGFLGRFANKARLMTRAWRSRKDRGAMQNIPNMIKTHQTNPDAFPPQVVMTPDSRLRGNQETLGGGRTRTMTQDIADSEAGREDSPRDVISVPAEKYATHGARQLEDQLSGRADDRRIRWANNNPGTTAPESGDQRTRSVANAFWKKGKDPVWGNAPYNIANAGVRRNR
tara:strand:+ start:268 stop:1302 length:1035 start_codon:yes stop_codon:yes gene_type:complete